MSLHDASGNPLTLDQAVGTLVDDGALSSDLYSRAKARAAANTAAALAAAQPTVPVDGIGNLALTDVAFVTICQWALRPYDSFDALRLDAVAAKVLGELKGWAASNPVSQANILLHLIWLTRTARLAVNKVGINPINLAADGAANLLVYWDATSATVAFGPGPDGAAGEASIVTLASGGFMALTGIHLGQAIAGRTYTLRAWLRAPSKSSIGFTIGAYSGAGDDVSQSTAIGPGWQYLALSQTFSEAGTQINVGIDNRSGHGGDGVAGDVWVSGVTITCES